MKTKQLVRKRDSFISVDKELFPFLNEVIIKEKEISDIRDEVIKLISYELDKAQARAKARLLGLNYCINTFYEYYKESQLFGGFSLTGGGVPRAYRYKADTTVLEVMWVGKKVHVNAVRSTVYPGSSLKPITVYDYKTVFEKLDEKLLFDKGYRKYLKEFGIDIDKEKNILHVAKHKQENIFIILLLGNNYHEIGFFNGKETLIIPSKNGTWLSFSKKFTWEKFLSDIVAYTKLGNSYKIVHDFLNQKIGAEYVQMLFYV